MLSPPPRGKGPTNGPASERRGPQHLVSCPGPSRVTLCPTAAQQSLPPWPEEGCPPASLQGEQGEAMNTTIQPAIVVGVCGSRASAAALRWAADEAQRRHAWLTIVRCWDPESRAPYAPVEDLLTRAQQREAAGKALAALVSTEFGTEIPAGVTAELAQGIAKRTLIDRSAGAGLLVLGSASPPTPTGRSIGPVIRACLSRAECPVVVCAADQAAASANARVRATGRRPRRASHISPLVLV